MNSPIQPAVGGALKVAVDLLREVVGPLEVLAAVVESEDGGEATETLIGNVKRCVEQFDRTLLASTSPAQTGEPVAWLDFDEASERIGQFPWMILVNQEHPLIKAKSKHNELFATRQTGGVDQAWVDKAMRSLEAVPIEEIARKAEAITSAAFTTGQYSHEAIRQLIRAVRDARTHLSTALGAKGK